MNILKTVDQIYVAYINTFGGIKEFAEFHKLTDDEAYRLVKLCKEIAERVETIKK